RCPGSSLAHRLGRQDLDPDHAARQAVQVPHARRPGEGDLTKGARVHAEEECGTSTLRGLPLGD
ncbi:MAG: hypothetical protein M3Q84_03100, partial [Actinomycetota bacterium]|nr:hypothetical protein [Actinomycetota bacterium]